MTHTAHQHHPRGIARRGSRVTALAVSLIALVFGSLATAEKNHVELWVGSSWDNVWPIVESALHDRYPEVTVTVTPGMGGADIASLRTALVSGHGPDLFFANAAPSRMGLLAEAGLLQPVDEYYQEYGWGQEILPWAQARAMFQGPDDAQPKLYGVPESVEFMAVFYKQSVFSDLGLSVPTTYQEFTDTLETLKTNGYLPILGGFRDTFPRGWFISTFFQASAGRAKIEDILAGNGSWNDPDILRAATAVKSLVDNGYLVPQSQSLGSDEAFQLWLNNPKAGLIVTGSWEVPDCIEQGCRFFALPPINPDLEAGLIGGVGGGLAISASAEDPDAAAKILDVLFSEDVQRAITEATGRIDPVTYDVTNWDLGAGVRQIADLALDPRSDVGYNLSVVTPSGFVDQYYAATQGLLIGQLSPEEYVSQLQDAWESSTQP